MNPFLKNFIDENFQEELKLINSDFSRETFEDWHSPAIEVSNLDKETLKKVKKISEKAANQFISKYPLVNKNDDWCSAPASDSWKELNILDKSSSYEKKYSFTDKKMIKTRKKTNIFQDTLQKKEILDLTTTLLGIPDTSFIYKIKILAVNPGGYVHPHKDKTPNAVKCMWIPLHEFPWCLKFFPFGWLKHKFGNGYLINNGKYVHAVSSNTKEIRYIMDVHFFNDTSNKRLLEWYNTNSNDWKNIFTNIYTQHT